MNRNSDGFDMVMMSVILVILFGLGMLGVKAFGADLPNPKYTPGLVDPAKTREVLCSPGYTTKTVRPPVSYTNRLKSQQLRSYYSGNDTYAEEDHVISLELGGDPKDARNLWPEPWNSINGAKVKDQCEDKLHRMVCKGTIDLKTAQDGIARNWITFCKQLP